MSSLEWPIVMINRPTSRSTSLAKRRGFDIQTYSRMQCSNVHHRIVWNGLLLSILQIG